MMRAGMPALPEVGQGQTWRLVLATQFSLLNDSILNTGFRILFSVALFLLLLPGPFH